MGYRVVIEKRAEKQLDKLDEFAKCAVLKWLKKNIDGCENPRAFGGALTGSLSEAWRYRIGIYRVLARIDDGMLKVFAFKIGHRKNVYRN
jgi:mRNA interferase RelE/StbE